jgi:hypothetical protein
MLLRDKVSAWCDTHTTHKLHIIGKMLNFITNQVLHIVRTVLKISNVSKDRKLTKIALLRV